MELKTKKQTNLKALLGLPPGKECRSTSRESKMQELGKLSPTIEHASIRKLLEQEQLKIQNRNTRVFKKDVSYMMDKPRPKNVSEAVSFPTDISLLKKMHMIGLAPSKSPLHFICPREECLEHSLASKELTENSSFKILEEYHRLFLGNPTGRQEILNLRKWFFEMKEKYLKQLGDFDENEKETKKQDTTHFLNEPCKVYDSSLEDLFTTHGQTDSMNGRISAENNLLSEITAGKKDTMKKKTKKASAKSKSNGKINHKTILSSKLKNTASKGSMKYLVPVHKSLIDFDDSIADIEKNNKNLLLKLNNSKSNSHRIDNDLDKLQHSVLKTSTDFMEVSSENDSYLENAYLIYSVCAKELIRQVTVDCIERGDLLRKLFNLQRKILLKREEHFKNKNEQLQKDHKIQMKKMNNILVLKNKDMNAIIGKIKNKKAIIKAELESTKKSEEDLKQKLEDIQLKLKTKHECFNCDNLTHKIKLQNDKIIELKMSLNNEILKKKISFGRQDSLEQPPSFIPKDAGMKDNFTQIEIIQFSKYTQCEKIKEKTDSDLRKLRSLFFVRNLKEKDIDRRITEQKAEKIEHDIQDIQDIRHHTIENTGSFLDPNEIPIKFKAKERICTEDIQDYYNDKLDNNHSAHTQGEETRIKPMQDSFPVDYSSSVLQISSESLLNESKIQPDISDPIEEPQLIIHTNIDQPTDLPVNMDSKPVEEVASITENSANPQMDIKELDNSLSQESNDCIVPTYEEESPPKSLLRKTRGQFNLDSDCNLAKSCVNKETQTEMTENSFNLFQGRSKKIRKSDILSYMSGTIREILKTKTAESKKKLNVFLDSMKDRRQSCLLPSIEASNLIQDTLALMNRRTKKITRFSEFNFNLNISTNEPTKKQSPAPKIMQNLMKKPMKSLLSYATMSRKFTGRIINQIYLSATTKQKNSDLDLPLLEFTYNEFAQKYGQSAVIEKKLIEFVCSMVKHAELNICKVFLRLMGVSSKISQPHFKPKVFFFFVKGLNFVLNSKVGIIVNPLDSIDKRYCPVSRANDFVRSETDILGKPQELIQKIEQISVQDPNKINPNGLIEIDLLLEMACDTFETYLNYVEDVVNTIYQTFEWEIDEAIETSDLMLVIGNCVSGRPHLVPETTNLYWDDFLDLIVLKNIVNVSEIQRLFDAGKYLTKDEVGKMVHTHYEEYKEIVSRLFSRNKYLYEVWLDRLEDCAIGNREPKLIAFAWKIFTMELDKKNKEIINQCS